MSFQQICPKYLLSLHRSLVYLFFSDQSYALCVISVFFATRITFVAPDESHRYIQDMNRPFSLPCPCWPSVVHLYQSYINLIFVFPECSPTPSRCYPLGVESVQLTTESAYHYDVGANQSIWWKLTWSQEKTCKLHTVPRLRLNRGLWPCGVAALLAEPLCTLWTKLSECLSFKFLIIKSPKC